MRKSVKILLLFICMSLCPHWVQAQWYERVCGVPDLEDLTADQFDCLWKKSNTVAITGGVISMVGTTVLVAGGITMAAADPCCSSGQFLIGYATVWSGLAIDLVGLPVWITGRHRKSVIRKSPHFNSQVLHRLSISPVLLKNNTFQSYSAGFELALCF
jgi:hypothetical protein